MPSKRQRMKPGIFLYPLVFLFAACLCEAGEYCEATGSFTCCLDETDALYCHQGSECCACLSGTPGEQGNEECYWCAKVSGGAMEKCAEPYSEGMPCLYPSGESGQPLGDPAGGAPASTSQGFSAGSAAIANAGVMCAVDLGQLKDGSPAGYVSLLAKNPDEYLADPLWLEAYVPSECDVVDPQGWIEQVKAPEVLAAIEDVGDYQYSIALYRDAEVGVKTNQYYQLLQGASPFVTWTIVNPDGASATNRLVVANTIGDSTWSVVYAYDDTDNEWEMTTGSGSQERVETRRSVLLQNDDRSETNIVQNAGGTNVYEAVRTYRTIFGIERLIEEVIDPEGAALTNTWSYETSLGTGSGELELVTRADGSWEKYTYDASGRLSTKAVPWEDSGPDDDTNNNSVVFTYGYTTNTTADTLAILPKRPRSVTRSVLGTVVEKTLYAHYEDVEEQRIKIEERCADPSDPWGDGDSLCTTWTYYPETYTNSVAAAGRLKLIEYPDGRLDTNAWVYGTYTNATTTMGTFTAATNGTYMCRTVTHLGGGTPAALSGKTTCETTITDPYGHVVEERTEVYTGSGYDVIDWTVWNRDDIGRLTSVYHAGGTSQHFTWSTNVYWGPTASTDVYGIETEYEYDSLGRVETSTELGISAFGDYPAQYDIETDVGYDPLGNKLTEQRSGGTNTLTWAWEYDKAGRMTIAVDPADFTNTTAYADGGRTVTRTQPGGVTEITARYRDGRMKSLTGTAVVSRYYDYAVETNGHLSATVKIGASDSEMWEKTETDPAGRVVSISKPGYSGTETTTHTYETGTALLEKTTQPGLALTWYEYDDLGSLIRTGLDLDGTNGLQLASTDRITDTDTTYVSISNEWWRQTVQIVYPTDDSSAPTTNSIVRVAAGGSGCGCGAEESVSIDIHGNETVTTISVNAASNIVTRAVSYPDSTNEAVTVTVNGLLQTSESKPGIETVYRYDSLGRLVETIDPRTGTNTTHYASTGLVDWVEDAAENRTTFAYNEDTGLKEAVIDPYTNAVRYAYNSRGQVTHTWGDTPYPVKNDYDDWGRMTEMRTYRIGTSWDDTTFPTNWTGDVTSWMYQESTGLLTNKQDAAGESVVYTYTNAMRLATRTWARQDGTNDLVTVYSYDSDTGELTGIDYSDDTTDIEFTYNRLGQLKTVEDYVGTRTFAYNGDLQVSTETIGSGGLYEGTLTRKYQDSGGGEVPGRDEGFQMEGSVHNITYGYDGLGRLTNVASSSSLLTNDYSFVYTYTNNTDLVQTRTESGAGLTVTRSYEPHRDLLTQVKNEIGTNVVSQYDYLYDAIGLRTSVVNQGTAFTDDAHNAWGYNDRGELTSSYRYVGSDPSTTTNEVTAQRRLYDYSPIGNREWYTEGTAIATEYSANNLNQYTATADPNEPFDYDEDGNMIEDGEVEYTWNCENRLVKVEPSSPSANDLRVSNGYDYMGRRVLKVVEEYNGSSWSTNLVTKFVYDGWNLALELDGLDDDYPIARYTWGLDLSQTIQGAGGIGGLLVLDESWSTNDYSTVYAYDAKGNVGQLIDVATGDILAAYEYDPYGQSIRIAGEDTEFATNNLFRFSTKYFDTEAGLYYFGRRSFSSSLGRWISRDPSDVKGGLNLYAYVANEPLAAYDPHGLRICRVQEYTKIAPWKMPDVQWDPTQKAWGSCSLTRWHLKLGKRACGKGKTELVWDRAECSIDIRISREVPDNKLEQVRRHEWKHADAWGRAFFSVWSAPTMHFRFYGTRGVPGLVDRDEGLCVTEKCGAALSVYKRLLEVEVFFGAEAEHAQIEESDPHYYRSPVALKWAMQEFEKWNLMHLAARAAADWYLSGIRVGACENELPPRQFGR